MKSQWECVLENLGEWVGSFTTVIAVAISVCTVTSFTVLISPAVAITIEEN